MHARCGGATAVGNRREMRWEEENNASSTAMFPFIDAASRPLNALPQILRCACQCVPLLAGGSKPKLGPQCAIVRSPIPTASALVLPCGPLHLHPSLPTLPSHPWSALFLWLSFRLLSPLPRSLPRSTTASRTMCASTRLSPSSCPSRLLRAKLPPPLPCRWSMPSRLLRQLAIS